MIRNASLFSTRELEGMFRGTWNRVRENPGLLYHYTNAAGLGGILESGSIWASDARHRNDTTEVEYGIRPVRELLENASTRCALPVVRQIFARARVHLAETNVGFRFFVASFCTDGDSLDMWRAYCQPGPGYALGLRLTDARFASDQLAILYRPVIYGAVAAQRVVSDFLSAVRERLETLAGSMEDIPLSVIDHTGIHLAAVLMTIVVTVKDPCFSSEREWRIVQVRSFNGVAPNGAIHARGAGAQSTLYVELDLRQGQSPYCGLLPLVSLTVGPAHNPTRMVQRVSALLEARGYDCQYSAAMVSDLPLRPAHSTEHEESEFGQYDNVP